MYSVILNGLDCANCAAKIESAVSKIEGIYDVSINFITTKLTFSCDDDKIEEIENKILTVINKVEPDIEVVL